MTITGRYAKWLNATDCKSVGSAFGGSNPPLPTTIIWPGTAMFSTALRGKVVWRDVLFSSVV